LIPWSRSGDILRLRCVDYNLQKIAKVGKKKTDDPDFEVEWNAWKIEHPVLVS
jgi:hypothetical protein